MPNPGYGFQFSGFKSRDPAVWYAAIRIEKHFSIRRRYVHTKNRKPRTVSDRTVQIHSLTPPSKKKKKETNSFFKHDRKKNFVSRIIDVLISGVSSTFFFFLVGDCKKLWEIPRFTHLKRLWGSRLKPFKLCISPLQKNRPFYVPSKWSLSLWNAFATSVSLQIRLYGFVNNGIRTILNKCNTFPSLNPCLGSGYAFFTKHFSPTRYRKIDGVR